MISQNAGGGRRRLTRGRVALSLAALLVACGAPASPTSSPVAPPASQSASASAAAPSTGPTASAAASVAATPTPTPLATAAPSAASPGPVPSTAPSPSAVATAEPSPSAPPSGSAGLVEVIAGGGVANPGDSGLATAALLVRPLGVAGGPDGSIWIVDSSSARLRVVSTDGIISTRTDRLFQPSGVAVDSGGNIYVTEAYRVLSALDDGRVEPVAGKALNAGFRGDGGPAKRALLFGPSDVAEDAAGNLYIADNGNHRIRMVDAATSSIRTIAGDGTEGFGGDGGLAKDAQLQRPAAVEVDADGSTLYIADTRNERLRAVDLTTGTITTIAGFGGPAVAYDPALIGLQTPTPQLNTIALDGAGNLYMVVPYTDLGRIVMQMAPDGTMTRVAGGGASVAPGVPALDFRMPDVTGMAIDPTTGALLIASSDGRVYRVTGVAAPVAP